MNLSTATLGIELGSTRIKAVLIDENHNPSVTAYAVPPPAGGPVGGSDSPLGCHSLPPTALRLPLTQGRLALRAPNSTINPNLLLYSESEEYGAEIGDGVISVDVLHVGGGGKAGNVDAVGLQRGHSQIRMAAGLSRPLGADAADPASAGAQVQRIGNAGFLKYSTQTLSDAVMVLSCLHHALKVIAVLQLTHGLIHQHVRICPKLCHQHIDLTDIRRTSPALSVKTAGIGFTQGTKRSISFYSGSSDHFCPECAQLQYSFCQCGGIGNLIVICRDIVYMIGKVVRKHSCITSDIIIICF